MWQDILLEILIRLLRRLMADTPFAISRNATPGKRTAEFTVPSPWWVEGQLDLAARNASSGAGRIGLEAFRDGAWVEIFFLTYDFAVTKNALWGENGSFQVGGANDLLPAGQYRAAITVDGVVSVGLTGTLHTV